MERQPDYAAKAAVKRFSGLRGIQYCEVFLITVDPANDSLAADFFNTTGLNNSNPKDTCPAAMWAKVNPEQLKEKHKVLGVFKNGPRGWGGDGLDRAACRRGPDVRRTSRSMDGPRGAAQGRGAGQEGLDSVQADAGHRKSTMTFEKGKPVFILDDPEGTPWVMQAFSKIVDPNLTYEQLADLATKLKPPAGWKYRVAKLDRDLTIRAVNGVAHIVQDELENTYDQCFSTACTYKP